MKSENLFEILKRGPHCMEFDLFQRQIRSPITFNLNLEMFPKHWRKGTLRNTSDWGLWKSSDVRRAIKRIKRILKRRIEVPPEFWMDAIKLFKNKKAVLKIIPVVSAYDRLRALRITPNMIGIQEYTVEEILYNCDMHDIRRSHLKYLTIPDQFEIIIGDCLPKRTDKKIMRLEFDNLDTKTRRRVIKNIHMECLKGVESLTMEELELVEFEYVNYKILRNLSIPEMILLIPCDDRVSILFKIKNSNILNGTDFDLELLYETIYDTCHDYVFLKYVTRIKPYILDRFIERMIEQKYSTDINPDILSIEQLERICYHMPGNRYYKDLLKDKKGSN
jgi:hypothetical protein